MRNEGPQGPVGTAGSRAGARILVTEDEGIIAKDLEMRLKRRGYNVPAVVASGEEAVIMAEKEMPDLVLMDIVLQGEIDGIEAAALIRQRFDIPIIYITAYADDGIINRAKITEPYGYIIKPFEDRELHTAIEMALYKHAMEKKVRESEEWLSTILRSIGDGVIAADTNGCVTFMNAVAEKLTGWTLEETKGSHIADIFRIISEQSPEPCKDLMKRIIGGRAVMNLSDDSILVAKDGAQRAILDSGAPIKDKNGNVLGVVFVFHDVTEQKKMDMALRESEKKLRMYSMELEEGNTALKVLLRQRENDRQELEENILANVKQLIFPYLDKLKRNKAMSEELTYLNILEKNLEEIVSPFSSKLSSAYYGFTPREIMIANLIKDGKQDKDIMELLNISFETVKSHRQNIRKKLGLYSKRINLRSHLMLLDKK